MLYNDKGVRVDLQGDSPIARDYQEKVKEIKKNYQFPLRFKTRFQSRINPTGEREPYQSTVALFKAYLDLPDGTREEVRYSRTSPKVKKNGRIEYDEGSGEVVTHAIVVNDKQMDKAYFMLYLCPTVKKKMLMLDNPKEEAAQTLKAASKMTPVIFYLNDEDSPLYNDENRIRLVALSLGVSNAENPNVSIEEVKVALIRHIEQGEAAGSPVVNVKAFKEATSMPEYYKRRAQIFRAIDKEVLRFNDQRMQYEVKFGKEFTKLFSITSSDIDSPEDALLRVLDINPDIRRLFEQAMDIEEEQEVSDEPITRDNIDVQPMSVLRRLCKDNDVPVFGKKKEVLITELIDVLKL